MEDGYTADAIAINPMGLAVARADRLIRGGGWSYSAQGVRAADRGWYAPGFRGGVLGFRCASSGRR